jgi:hypothetical protein
MNEKINEYILCAAIHFDDGTEYDNQPKNINTGIVLCGFRHGCIFPQLNFASKGKLRLVKDRLNNGIEEKSQGFITSHNRYVEREEALIIALANDQVLDLKEVRGNRLYSEDLY